MAEEGDIPVEGEEQKPFAVDRAKTGRAGCKKCKQKIEVGALRFAKLVPSPFGSSGRLMKSWHHLNCMFEIFAKQRKTTRKVESVDDIEGWDDLVKEDQEEILSLLPDSVRTTKPSPVKVIASSSVTTTSHAPAHLPGLPSTSAATVISNKSDEYHKDNSFREFRRLCADVANASSYIMKTKIVKELFTSGTDKNGFQGDLLLWCRLLLPGAIKRIYNLQSKQLIKLFSRIFREDQDEMLIDLEQGDVAETIGIFFEKNKKVIPSKKCQLSLQQVDKFLEHLSKLTKEEDQIEHFTQIAEKCTVNDLKMIIRLVKHDLRINAGPKHILDAVHPDAYEAFQASRDINSIISRASFTTKSSKEVNMVIGIHLLTPVLPMLAQPCKSVGEAMRKCPNGLYSEIKYDGERVQVHKKGSEFKYYSRSLKPVLAHKVNHFKQFIPQAFPYGNDLILDSEILLVDLDSGKPLPFGSLGKHKKSEFQNASVCLFVFDCIFYNGESLMHKPVKKRRKILEHNMIEIKNHIMFSELQEIHNASQLESMMTKVFKLGLEGLVLKDLQSIYEPGKRHWLKMKRDYLMDGAMADSADLVVLGAWYGTGQKGGMMSVFLMGCYDQRSNNWYTVTKVHTGHDDNTLARLQNELDMVKISKDVDKVPAWLNCTKTMIPDFVARDPKAQPVWEITGAEFTQHEVHTSGISIRFPRITKVREDKDWASATSLSELKKLYKKSKDTSDFALTSSTSHSSTPSPSPSPMKRPLGNSPSPKKRSPDTSSQSVTECLTTVKNKLENSSSSVELETDELYKKSKDTSVFTSSTSHSPTSTSIPNTKTPSSSPSPSRTKKPPLGDSPSSKKRSTDTSSQSVTEYLTSVKNKLENSSSSVELKTVEVTDVSSKKTFKRDILSVKCVEDLSDEPPKKNRKVLKKPLPDVFVGVKLKLPEAGLPTRELLERYYIAYGGEVLPEEKVEDSTHFIVTQYTKQSELIKGAKNVDVAWLWDSIKLQKLQDTLMYTRKP